MNKRRALIEQICHALGKNNDASYAVVTVAAAKGIFRPMFTMMDEHEDYETKKYTALREGITEAIAIPCYLSVAWAAKNIVAPMICKSQTKEATKKAAKTLSFLGVCTAALVIIPALCSALVNPIMDFSKRHLNHGKNKNKHIDIKEPETAPAQITIEPQAKPETSLTKPFTSFMPIKYNSNLTIGGGN